MGGSGGLVIFGVSNVLGDIFDCAQALGLTVRSVVMNQPEVVRERTRSIHDRLAEMDPRPLLVGLDEFRTGENEMYFLGTTAAARGELVAEVTSRFQVEFCSLVHPAAYLASSVRVGSGVYVGANSVVGAAARLDDFVYVNRGVTVGHDTRVRAYARLQPGCNVGGHVVVGRGATIGMGASVIEELVVGERAYIGAGAVVIRDVEPATLMVGVPAIAKKRLD